MFLKTYFIELFTGKPKEAFDVHKTFSDIVAMGQRAVWSFLIGIAALKILTLLTHRLAWWQIYAAKTTLFLFAYLIPILLLVGAWQVGIRGFAAVVHGGYRWTLWVTFTLLFVLLAACVVITAEVAISNPDIFGSNQTSTDS